MTTGLIRHLKYMLSKLSISSFSPILFGDFFYRKFSIQKENWYANNNRVEMKRTSSETQWYTINSKVNFEIEEYKQLGTIR